MNRCSCDQMYLCTSRLSVWVNMCMCVDVNIGKTFYTWGRGNLFLGAIRDAYFRPSTDGYTPSHE